MEYSVEQIEKWIVAYLSGAATENEIEALTAWVEESPENRRQYEQFKNLWQEAYPSLALTDEDVEKAHQRVMEKLDAKSWMQLALEYWQRAAAILLLPLLSLSIYLYYIPGKLPEGKVSYQEIYIPFGTHSRIDLPDGSTAWLNAGTRLKFPSTFKKGERLVTLSGEAFFEVKADKENPFIVRTDLIDVKATGTAFDVEAYDHEPVAVTMVSGKVDINLANRAESIPLQPGERISYNKKDTIYHIIRTDPYKWCAWKDGSLVFKDDSLGYIFKKIGRRFNVDIILKDPQIGSQPYRVAFEEEALSVILDLMKLTAPIDYKMKTQTKTFDDRFEKKQIEVYSRKK